MPNPWEYGSEEEKRKFGELSEAQYNELLAQLNAQGIDPTAAWGAAGQPQPPAEPAPVRQFDQVGAGLDPAYSPSPDGFSGGPANEPSQPPQPAPGAYDSVGANLDGLLGGENVDALSALSPRPGPINWVPQVNSLLVGEDPSAVGGMGQPRSPVDSRDISDIIQNTRGLPRGGYDTVIEDIAAKARAMPHGAYNSARDLRTIVNDTQQILDRNFQQRIDHRNQAILDARRLQAAMPTPMASPRDPQTGFEPDAEAIARARLLPRGGYSSAMDLYPAERPKTKGFFAALDDVGDPITRARSDLETMADARDAVADAVHGRSPVADLRDAVMTPIGRTASDMQTLYKAPYEAVRRTGIVLTGGGGYEPGTAPAFSLNSFLNGVGSELTQSPLKTWASAQDQQESQDEYFRAHGINGTNPKVGGSPVFATALEAGLNPASYAGGLLGPVKDLAVTLAASEARERAKNLPFWSDLSPDEQSALIMAMGTAMHQSLAERADSGGSLAATQPFRSRASALGIKALDDIGKGLSTSPGAPASSSKAEHIIAARELMAGAKFGASYRALSERQKQEVDNDPYVAGQR